MRLISKIKEKINKKAMATFALAMVAMSMAFPASAAPNTGDADVDTILSSLESAFGTVKDAFVYLALAAIPITLIVVAFFWIRGKFKQAVSGA